MMFFAVLLVGAGLAEGAPALPSQACWADQVCQADLGNLLLSLDGVESAAECLQLCTDSPACTVFSHLGPANPTSPSHCLLLSSCPGLLDCEDCRTEVKTCFGSCDAQFEGEALEDALDIITYVEDEPACLHHCTLNPDCIYFTYFDSTAWGDFPNLCVLQTEIQLPVQACEHCRTGIPDCSNSSSWFCLLSVGSQQLSAHKFTDPGVTNVSVTALGDCEVAGAAVGLGGSAVPGSWGGGGSGSVETATIRLSYPTELRVRVGDYGAAESYVELAGGDRWLRAGRGEDAVGGHGGSGYSGGGGGGVSYNCGAGGRDGGNGEGLGGAGSGMDLARNISLSAYLLSPGDGGATHTAVTGSCYGGGGGGVLLDGAGPQDTQWDGAGYGGGQGGYWREEVPGNPGQGLVLLEIQPKQP